MLGLKPMGWLLDALLLPRAFLACLPIWVDQVSDPGALLQGLDLQLQRLAYLL